MHVGCSLGYSCSYHLLSSHCCAVCSVHYYDVFAAGAAVIEDIENTTPLYEAILVMNHNFILVFFVVVINILSKKEI